MSATRQEIAVDFAQDAYEYAMDNGESRLSKAICEYMDAIREQAFEVEKAGGDAMIFMADLHGNIDTTLQAGL